MADLHCRIQARIPTRTRIPVLYKYYGKGIQVWIRTNVKSLGANNPLLSFSVHTKLDQMHPLSTVFSSRNSSRLISRRCE